MSLVDPLDSEALWDLRASTEENYAEMFVLDRHLVDEAK